MILFNIIVMGGIFCGLHIMLVKKRIKRTLKGFNGVTHILIGILIFAIVISLNMYNIRILDMFMIFIMSSVWNIIIVFFIITGGSLFPDLDSNRSTAEFRLGNTGKFISSFMISSGTIIWTLYHFKYDQKVSFMHRAIWHSPFILFLASFLTYKYVPEGSNIFAKEFLNLGVKEIPIFFIENITVIVILFIAYLFIRLSIATITYRIFKKVFKKQYIADFVSLIASIPFVVKISMMAYSDIKIVSYLLIFGYGTHLFGDLFTRGSIPLVYPLPIKRQAYYRPNFPLQISTNEGPSKITNNIIIITIFFIIIYNIYNIRLHMS